MMFQYLLVWIQIHLIATIFAEFPPKFVHDASSEFPAGHLKPLGYHRAPEGPVVEEKGHLHPTVFWERYVSIHRPMVFRGAVSQSPAIKQWNDEYLVEKFGDLDLIVEVKRENRTTNPNRMNLSNFISKYKEDDIYAVTVLPDPMRADVQVPSCLLCGTFKDYVHETNFWMGSGGTRSVIHYDADENIHCIINGSKDFIMIENKFKNFLPFEKSLFSGSGFSSLNPDALDLITYPDMAKIQWTYAKLYPGDCIYIPSEYLHQVRSYKRTISATMLFTTDVDHSFEDTNCKNASFDYMPLSVIDVHWTYKKGDRTIDMGYINIELLRKRLLQMMSIFKQDLLTLDVFKEFYKTAAEEEEFEPFDVEKLFTSMFDVTTEGVVTKDQIKDVSREKLKLLARSIDSPHGPVNGLNGEESSGNIHKDEKYVDKKDEL